MKNFFDTQLDENFEAIKTGVLGYGKDFKALLEKAESFLAIVKRLGMRRASMIIEFMRRFVSA